MSGLRKDLRAITAEGAAASVMVGIGENYLPAFVLALTSSPLACGLVATVPLVAGALLQLVSPYAVRRLRSYRRWVVICAVLQTIGFLPLVAAAVMGNMPTLAVFALATLYFATNLAGGPAWNAWIGPLVPRSLWARYFSRRTRVSQLGLLIGFALGGALLQAGVHLGETVLSFALLFLIAAASRTVSARLLAGQREPCPPGNEVEPWNFLRLARSLGTDSNGRLLIYLLVAQAAVQISGPYFTPFMLKQLHFSYLDYMILTCAAMVAKVIFLPAMGRLADRWGTSQLLWITAAAIVPLPAMWILSTTFPYLFCVQIYSGMVWAGYELATLLLFFETIPAERRLGVLSVFNLANSTAIALGSFVGAGLLAALGANHGGYAALFAASSLVRAGAILLLVRLPRRASQPTVQWAQPEVWSLRIAGDDAGDRQVRPEGHPSPSPAPEPAPARREAA